MSEVIATLERHKDNFRNREDFNELHAAAFVQNVTAYYQKSTAIHSKSRRGVFILNLSKTRRLEAAWIWWALSGAEFTSISGTTPFAAAFKLLEFEGELENTKSQVQALQAIDEQYRVALASEDQLFKAEVDKTRKLRTAVNAMLSEAKQAIERADSAHGELRLGHSKLMQEIQDKYQTELAVRSAVNYWSTIARHHRDCSKRWGITSIVYGVIAFLGVFLLHRWLTGIPNEIQSLIDTKAILAADVPNVLLRASAASVLGYLPLALLLIWPLRILIRNYLSSSHLAADATERAMIVRTYVALVNDPDISKGNDLKAQVLPPALASIFRHAADGIVKDDGMPWQSVIDAVKGSTGGK